MKFETARVDGKKLCLLLCVFLVIAIVCTVILASVPPVDRDGLTHHLFVPKLWLQQGMFANLPDIRFSYYPMSLDLLYTIPLALGNDIAPKYIHYFFALLSASLVFAYLRKRLGMTYALLGALFFLSIPIILKLSITVYVDLGVIFFSTASLLLLLFWAEHGAKKRYLLLAGLCCGMAAGVKYNGLVAIVVLTLLVPLIYMQLGPSEEQKNRKAIWAAILFALVTLTVFSPWMIRNAFLTGNPVYPLHDDLVQSLLHDGNTNQITAGEGLQQLSTKGSQDLTSRQTLYGESFWQTILLPIRFFFEGQDDNPRYFDGKLNPFLLILSVLAFYFRPRDVRQRKEQIFLAAFVLLFFFLTFLQESSRIRYVAAIVPAMVILCMYGLHGLLEFLRKHAVSPANQKKWPLLAGSILCLLMLGYNAMYFVTQFRLVQPLAYLSGEVDRDTYITAFRPEYAAIKQANALLGPETKVLCMFLGNRGYYMDFTPIFVQPYESSGLISRFLHTEGDILERLREKKISHVLIRDDLTQAWWQDEQWWSQQMPEGKKRLLPLMQASANPLYRGYSHTFFAVPPPQ